MVDVVVVDNNAVKSLQPLDVAEEVLQSDGRRHCLAAVERHGAAVTPRQASTSKYFQTKYFNKTRKCFNETMLFNKNNNIF